MILGLVDEAVAAGARQDAACDLLGIDPRALQRWRKQGVGDDRRAGPKRPPPNKLSQAERKEVLDVLNEPAHRDLSPKQIVPRLAEEGRYVASESTMYRTLREEGQQRHREPTKAPTRRRPAPLQAKGPNQVWSWDITYLRASVPGIFYYFYLVIDVWSRKIVGWRVEEEENGEHAARLFTDTCKREGILPGQLTTHSDNGAPMKSGTFLALLQMLGVASSFSRPGVSDDNPFSEALFRTFKYRPEYPTKPFVTVEDAREFVEEFVRWYNREHRHSAIRFVTPHQRHCGLDREILARRRRTYEQARARRPDRWPGKSRNWDPIAVVTLNPAAGRPEAAA